MNDRALREITVAQGGPANGFPREDSFDITVASEVMAIFCLADGLNALLVEPRQPAVLAAAMGRMIDDAPLRRRLAWTALDDVRSRYSWRAVGRQIQDVYGRLCRTRPDTAWTALYDPATTAEAADPSCRFRSEPHLL